jgi:nitrous oxide reductase accessory protein NosL
LKIVSFIVWFSLLSIGIHADSDLKIKKLSHKGERIVLALCDKEKLPDQNSDIAKLIEEIRDSKACPPLSLAKAKAVAYFIAYENKKEADSKPMDVPLDAKCPVCGMFVSKYPKWAASMKHDEKVYYFDGVKDLMKYKLFDGDFQYARNHIEWIHVSDYYTIEPIIAKDAYYVLGSDVYGPMGHELIAFKTKKSAQTFMKEHHGKKIISYDEITDSIILALDGIE